MATLFDSDKTTRQHEQDTPPHIEKLPPLDAPPDLGQPPKRAAKSKSDVSWLFVILAGLATLLLLTIIIGGNLLLWFNSDHKPLVVAQEATPTALSVPVTPSATPDSSETKQTDARVSVLQAPLWASPNFDSNILVTYPENTLLRLIGRNENSSWLQVEGAGGQVGWMLAEMLELNIPLDQVPVVVVEPIATAQATETVIAEEPVVESEVVIDEEEPASIPITVPAIEVPAIAIEASEPAIEAPSAAIQPNLELPSTIEVAPIDVPEVLGLPEVELPTDLELPKIDLPIGEGLPDLGEGLPELPIGEGLPNLELPIGGGLPDLNLPVGEGLPALPIDQGLPELPIGEGLPELPIDQGLPELPIDPGLIEQPINEAISEIEAELPTEIELPMLPPIKIPWP